ncbi:MAG: 2-oxoglutarate dehydrogenase [Acidobacteria bacterium]|nr:MAG: 2-oxoglutarate dehydrogenase [Acidobacteriota bacterium]
MDTDAFGKPLIPLTPASIYRFGHLIRLTESLLLKLFSEGLLSGTTHTCLGQELCQISVVRALHQPHDRVLSNHRNHGHFLAYTGDFLGLLAEIMGRKAGVCGGIGGSQHLSVRNFHSNGVQGGMTAIGVGQALARRMWGEDGITAIIVGDGTLGQGLLYESMNLASVWRLPVLFVIENNRIAQTTPTRETIGGEIASRGAAFGLETTQLDDAHPGFLRDVETVVAGVRAGRPSLLVIDTERLGPHSKGDDLRDSGEMERIRRRDPLAAAGRALDAVERAAVERENEEFIELQHQQALASPPAEVLVAEKTICLPAQSNPAAGHTAPAGNVRLQLNSALEELLRDDPRVVLLGEDLHDPYGGAFKVTANLSTRFPGRVISTPISEAAVTGAGIGLALEGCLPIVEVMFADFITLAMDQIFNHAVKFPGMFSNTRVPLVIRTPCGGRRGYGPTHSQSPESIMTAVPGLTVVFPSHRHAAGAILKNAVLRWPNPTLFCEHKLLYSETASRGEYEVLPDNGNDIGLELFPTLAWGGDAPDITLVAYGGILPAVEQLRDELTAEELRVEIVAPSLLAPLPRVQLYDRLRSREAVVAIEEGYAEAGFGAMLGALLLEGGFRGRFARVHPPPVPIPAARSLETRVLPGRDAMLQGVLSVLGV